MLKFPRDFYPLLPYITTVFLGTSVALSYLQVLLHTSDVAPVRQTEAETGQLARAQPPGASQPGSQLHARAAKRSSTLVLLACSSRSSQVHGAGGIGNASKEQLLYFQ